MQIASSKPPSRPELAPTLAAAAALVLVLDHKAPPGSHALVLVTLGVCAAAPWLRRPAPAWLGLAALVAAVAGSALWTVLTAQIWPLALLPCVGLAHRRWIRSGARDDALTIAGTLPLLALAMVYRSPELGMLPPLVIWLFASVYTLARGSLIVRDRRVHVALGLLLLLGGLGGVYFARGHRATASLGTNLALVKVARGMPEPTDVQFLPGRSDTAVVLGRGGQLWAVDVNSGAVRLWFRTQVHVNLECGLIGLAFHPDFPRDPRFYLHQCVKRGPQTWTEIVEWRAPRGIDAAPQQSRLVLDLEQPWDNHNGGQLRFGPDGFLYVGVGDGGNIGDPNFTAQNLGLLYGKLLRIDPLRPPAGAGYAIPPDNPFRNQPEARPEIWAFGLRNPWRFDFLPDGRVIVGDVGDAQWEEIDIVAAGNNLGWSVEEGKHCFKPQHDCSRAELVDPIHEYPHSHGVAVVGGVMYQGSKIPRLAGKLIFADFAKSWIAAITPAGVVEDLGLLAEAPSAFARDARGEVYVANYASGTLARLELRGFQ